MPDRRALSFSRLDDVMPEVERLLAGHETVGRWSLAQICTHLAAALRLTVEGLPDASDAKPPMPPPGSDQARAVAVARRRMFHSGRFPDGAEMPSPALDPGPPDGDPRASAEALRQAIAQFLHAPGPFPAHPLLGPMDKTEWERFHCIHCAHHLGFAIP